MTLTHYLISDLEFEKQLIYNLKNRNIDQKFIYMDEGAAIYYKSTKNRETKYIDKEKDNKSAYNFIQKYINKGKKTVIISLGCGNANPEKKILKELKSKGYNLSYLGIDSSKEMLELAIKNLDTIKIDKKFVCADLIKENFKEEISRLTSGFESRIFAFLGGTFNNSNQTLIIDSLYNILDSNDMLFLDVPTRPNLNSSDDMKIFNRYSKFLDNKWITNSYFYPLKRVGISFENGKMLLKTSKEEALGTLLFTFYFLFTKKTIISFRGEIIHFLPNEKIDLLSIRAYHSKTLINFFKEHNFKFIKTNDNKISDELTKSQFLFSKINLKDI